MGAELKIGIGADNSELNKSLHDAEKRISAFVDKVGQIGALGEKLSSMGQSMTVGLTLPIVGLGAAAVKSYGDLQSLKMGLEAVMGSSQAASSEFEKLREVAKLPGLGLKEAAKGSVALQSAGFSADMARRSLMAFGNALATVGKGANELDFVNLALTQLQNKTSGFGQDLRQLTEQLPQLRGALSTAFGTADSEEIAKLGYTGAQVVQMITTEFEKLPKVTGGINNAFENLSDNIFISASRIGKIIDDNFDISGIIDKITGFVDKAVTAFESLSPSIQNTILVVAGLAAAAGPLLIVIGGIVQAIPLLIAGIGGVSVAFTTLTGPIGLVVLGIGAIIAAVVSNWDKIKPYIESTINGLIDLYNESKVVRLAVQSIGFAFNTAFSVVGKILTGVWESFKTFGKGILELFAGIGTAIKGALTGDFDGIKAGFTRGFAAINSTVIGFGNNFKGTLNEIGNAFTENEKKWSNMGKKAHIKLNPAVDVTGDVEKKTDEAVTQGVQKGVAKANANKNTVKIELPDIEAIEMGKSSGFINNLGEQYDTLFQFAVRTDEISGMINNSVAKIDFTPIGENIKNATDIAAENAERMKLAGNEFVNSVNSMISDGFVEGISQAFEAMGGAMLNGGNILAAAGGAILGVLGSFMQMLGKEMIKLAVATIALGNLVSGIKKWIIANPGAAIALAGVAIVAGTLLSAAGSNIGGGSGGGGSTSGSAGGGSQSYSSSYSSGGGYGNGGEVVFRISGNDLVGVLSRQQDKNTRLGG